MRLSILDQTPIRRGTTAYATLEESVQLIKAAERLGYYRYWISEHHNMPTLAAAAPEVLLARLGAETSRIRLGSGGIMLPNHSALKVAENFRLLEALFPGRVDLGIGRAPGGDRTTAALLNPINKFDPKDYVEQIEMLHALVLDNNDSGIIPSNVKAIPIIHTSPEMWMLTSSGESAYLAAHFGMALSFAHFINPVGGPEALDAYRKLFKPSATLSSPQTSVAIFAFCGETEEKAAQMQAVMDYRLLSFAKGERDVAPSYESVKHYRYSPDELAFIQQNRGRMIIGTMDHVSEKVTQLLKRYQTEEVVLATFADTFEDRLRSYELFAEAFKPTTNQ